MSYADNSISVAFVILCSMTKQNNQETFLSNIVSSQISAKKTASNLANDPTSILADDPTSNLQPKVHDTSGTQPDYLGRMLLKAPHIVNRAACSF